MEYGLSFTGIIYSKKQTPLTLASLLYKNGAGCRVKDFSENCKKGIFGEVVVKRLTLVIEIYEHLNSIVSSGKSRKTLENNIHEVKAFYMYGDKLDVDITSDNARDIYQAWVKHKYVSVGAKGDSQSFYGKLSSLANILGSATGLGRDHFVLGSMLKPPPRGDKGYAKVDRQDLQETRAFVDDLLDIRACLGTSAFIDKLPITIQFADGNKADLYGGLSQWEKKQPQKLKSVGMNTRYSLYNLRVECELLLFISQTSMNLTPAASMKIADYRFENKGEMCEVREYKNRKRGEVVFTIYSVYKPYFLEFLEFRKSLNIDLFTDKIFGRVPQLGQEVCETPHPRSLSSFMKKYERNMLNAGVLRKTRQNWLARRSGDPEMAAEMAQHDLETYYNYYSRPHHQTAAAQWTTFFKSSALEKKSVMEGMCNGAPESVPKLSEKLDKPDCINPQLCMFCLNYKGIKSYSYIWSLLSYRYLKQIEHRKSILGRSDASGFELVFNRIEEISAAFRSTNDKCRKWADKAVLQIEQQNYHKRWDGYIQIMKVVLS